MKDNKSAVKKNTKTNKAKSGGKNLTSIRYLTKEGIKNIVERRAMSFTSILVLFSCLVLVGIAAMGFINLNSFIGKVQDQNVIMVFAEENISKENLESLKESIKKTENVKKIDFISKEDGYEQLKKDMGENAVIFEGLEENPLPDAFEVHLKNQEGFSKTVKALSKLPNVQYIRENRNIANQLLSIKKTMSYASITLIVLLLFVSLVIIDNTIRLTIENRKLQISIMKSVGATNWFIRWPFMVEGMMIGLISAVLALFATWGVYALAGKGLSSLISSLSVGGFVPFSKWALVLLLAFVVFGVTAGAAASAFSTGRFLKEKEFTQNAE